MQFSTLTSVLQVVVWPDAYKSSPQNRTTYRNAEHGLGFSYYFSVRYWEFGVHNRSIVPI